jgi:hypothetical protein
MSNFRAGPQGQPRRRFSLATAVGTPDNPPSRHHGDGPHSGATARGCYVQATACRPRSVIVSQVTLIGRTPACTVPGLAVASPSSTKRPNIPIVKPCANKTDSVHPAGERASIRSARFCSAPGPLFRGLTAAAQALARRLLPPVRPRIGTNDAAARAHHARSECWHGHIASGGSSAGRRPEDRHVAGFSVLWRALPRAAASAPRRSSSSLMHYLRAARP